MPRRTLGMTEQKPADKRRIVDAYLPAAMRRTKARTEFEE